MAQTRTRTFKLINTNNMKLNDRNYEIPTIFSNKTSSLDDSYGTLQSCNDDSILSDRRNNRYVKHSKLNRNDDHITSLKRRVRKQQTRHEENQITDFQLPSSSSNVFLISYSQPSKASDHCRTKKSSCVVPLPPLITNSRIKRTRVQGISLSMFGY